MYLWLDLLWLIPYVFRSYSDLQQPTSFIDHRNAVHFTFLTTPRFLRCKARKRFRGMSHIIWGSIVIEAFLCIKIFATQKGFFSKNLPNWQSKGKKWERRRKNHNRLVALIAKMDLSFLHSLQIIEKASGFLNRFILQIHRKRVSVMWYICTLLPPSTSPF